MINDNCDYSLFTQQNNRVKKAENNFCDEQGEILDVMQIC